MLRGLFDWVVSWAQTPYGVWALGILAFTESSFFPIPPDPLLIVLALGDPSRALWYALLASIASVLGGMLGYLIGWGFMEAVGNRIMDFYGGRRRFDAIKALYDRYDAWAVGIAGFTPIPYKLFTISAGVFRINFKVFVLVSAVSRSARFFLVAGVIYLFGESIQSFIDQYFNLLSLLFVILLVLGFVVVRWGLNRTAQPQSSR